MDKATEKLQKRNKDTSASNKYRNERKAHSATKDKLRDKTNECNEAQDFVRTLTQENIELNNIVKAYKARYEKECTHYTTDQSGNVTSITELQAYRDYAHIQELDKRMKYINTKLYQDNVELRFVSVDNGNYVINEKKYKKYLIAGGLI